MQVLVLRRGAVNVESAELSSLMKAFGQCARVSHVNPIDSGR